MNRTSRRTFLKSSATAVVAGGAWLNPQSLAAIGTSSEEPQRSTALAAVVDVAKISPPISKYMYGMFLEHLGALTYRSLWSEVLDDRKFYFPVTSAQPEPTPRRAFGRPLRKWVPIDRDEFVTMDAEHAYVGEHSPRISLEGATPHGIQQSGLSLRKRMAYSGRVALAGAPGTKVEVSLSWGTGAGDRQVITVS